MEIVRNFFFLENGLKKQNSKFPLFLFVHSKRSCRNRSKFNIFSMIQLFYFNIAIGSQIELTSVKRAGRLGMAVAQCRVFHAASCVLACVDYPRFPSACCRC